MGVRQIVSAVEKMLQRRVSHRRVSHRRQEVIPGEAMTKLCNFAKGHVTYGVAAEGALFFSQTCT